MKRIHQMPFGAECREDGSVRFRLWAPKAATVEVQLAAGKSVASRTTLERLGEGWFELVSDEAGPGSSYKYLIDGKTAVPDPASRFQPSDVHGGSQVVDPREFEWSDSAWHGRPWEDAVIYELHVGTFTPEGTFHAIESRLDYLADLGVTAVELMPVADFPGSRNWGYDGVLLYAPDGCYGRPDDLKRLIDAAHAKDLMIFLDVVYNHFGPEGNYLRAYAPQFFTDRHPTPWGEGINFDGPCSRAVREFFIHNALYWLEEYHFDGLRLDAVHAIRDDSAPDILTELAERIRAHFGSDRYVHLVLENDDNAAHYLQSDRRSKLYDAQWNDDFHHALQVLLTGESDGYYVDYAERPLEHLGRCMAEGFDYQGQPSLYRQNQPRGEPSRDLPPTAFVSFLQNHDQAGNRAFGERILELAEGPALRAATAVLCLAPAVPLLFMGEEFGASTPFLFFSDFEPELAKAVTAGRRNEFARFARFQDARVREAIPDPSLPETFQGSRLDWNSLNTAESQEWLKFYRDLLRVRREKIVPLLRERGGVAARYSIDGSVLSVQWQLGQAKLTLLANLSDEAAGSGSGRLGRPAYSFGEVSAGSMSAWSVAWFVSP